MLSAVYAIICLGAASLSFLAFFDREIIYSLRALKALRVVTVAVLTLCWREPLLTASNVFSLQSGVPGWIYVPVPLVLMLPYLYSSVQLFREAPDPDAGFAVSNKVREHARKKKKTKRSRA